MDFTRPQQNNNSQRRRQHSSFNTLSERFEAMSAATSAAQRNHRRSGPRRQTGSRQQYVFRAVRTDNKHHHRPQQQQPRRVHILAPNEDKYGCFLGARYENFGKIEVPGQTRDQRWSMVRKLRALGFLDVDEYPTAQDFIESLPHLHRREDIFFVMDVRVYNFLLAGWMKEGTFDFYMSTTTYDRIITKLHKNADATVPVTVTKYGRNTMDVQVEWP